MVATFTIARTSAAALLLAAGALGCSASRHDASNCLEVSQVVFEPSLEAKGEHTVEIAYDETTITCVFAIGEHVTPTGDTYCDPEAILAIPVDVPSDSPTMGPGDSLPVVRGVTLFGFVDEVTVAVDGTSYGPLATQYVDATEDICGHNEAVVQLE